jgi:hypothetical protein
VTFINTKGMAFFGPGSEWFWAALQFVALTITFIAIYRQLRIARSARAVEQVQEYTARYESERMHRHRLAIFIALREGMEIPPFAGGYVGDYFDSLATLSRKGHLDTQLLWYAHSHSAQAWWTILDPFIKGVRAEFGAKTYADWEWLAGKFVEISLRAGDKVVFDAAWVGNHLSEMVETNQEAIRVEQALRSLVIASPDGSDTAQSAAVAPAPGSSPSPGLTAQKEQEHQSD